MKKLVLMLAVVFSVSLFSCGNSDKKAAEEAVVEEAPVEVVEEVAAVADSVATDSVAVAAEGVEAVEAPAAGN
ncbi:MAG: hypothetical protein LIO90_06835 [Bacteroidales bacterium]|nr:hypothetical protein [Bacteroidales bacterium]